MDREAIQIIQGQAAMRRTRQTNTAAIQQAKILGQIAVGFLVQEIIQAILIPT